MIIKKLYNKIIIIIVSPLLKKQHFLVKKRVGKKKINKLQVQVLSYDQSYYNSST